MENPFRRLRELTRTSQKDFGAKYHFSKTTMTYVESGQYPAISDSLNIALGQECAEKHVDAKSILFEEYGSQTLADAYARWQSNSRLEIASRFQQPFNGRSDANGSPFHYFMIDIAGSRQGFCKLLKVPAASVMRYADGTTRTMPKSIEDALKEVRFQYLPELLSLQEKWASNR